MLWLNSIKVVGRIHVYNGGRCNTHSKQYSGFMFM
jgi:hypothetical protein